MKQQEYHTPEETAALVEVFKNALKRAHCKCVTPSDAPDAAQEAVLKNIEKANRDLEKRSRAETYELNSAAKHGMRDFVRKTYRDKASRADAFDLARVPTLSDDLASKLLGRVTQYMEDLETEDPEKVAALCEYLERHEMYVPPISVPVLKEKAERAEAVRAGDRKKNTTNRQGLREFLRLKSAMLASLVSCSLLVVVLLLGSGSMDDDLGSRVAGHRNVRVFEGSVGDVRVAGHRNVRMFKSSAGDVRVAGHRNVRVFEGSTGDVRVAGHPNVRMAAVA